MHAEPYLIASTVNCIVGQRVVRKICQACKTQKSLTAEVTEEFKKVLGKLNAPDDMDTIVDEERFIKLPITLYHGQMAGILQLYHRDPFDRMLIAQAQAEGLTIITSDEIFSKYGVKIMKSGE